MLEEMEHNIAPSIQVIITQNSKELKQEEINRLFKISNLPYFCTLQFKQHPTLRKNNIFASFIQVLDDWNQKIEQRLHSANSRSQLFRNQFIYTSLQNIILQNHNVNQNLQKLYAWYQRNNSSEKSFITIKNNHQKISDEDWEVRKTFRTNIPHEISNYRRRQFQLEFLNTFNKQTQSLLMNETRKIGGSQQQSRIKNNYTNDLEKNKDNEVTLLGLSQSFKIKKDNIQSQNQTNLPNKMTQWSQFKLQQQQLRDKREIQQIKIAQSNWKLQKSRYQKQTTTNYYNGQFNKNTLWNENKKLLNKTDTFYHIKKRKLDQFFGYKTFIKQNINENHVLSIDGLNLIANPFELKKQIKKKK